VCDVVIASALGPVGDTIPDGLVRRTARTSSPGHRRMCGRCFDPIPISMRYTAISREDSTRLLRAEHTPGPHQTSLTPICLTLGGAAVCRAPGLPLPFDPLLQFPKATVSDQQVSDKPLGLRERNRIRTRDEILVAISVLLGERPYQSITVDEVAQQAGVSRGTIYSYFPEGRDQLVRDAYVRIAAQVTERGSSDRAAHTRTIDRVLALATALASISATPEGRFYGAMGPDAIAPLVGHTGTASTLFRSMLREDLERAAEAGELPEDAPVPDLTVLISGALRQIGVTAANEPARTGGLLRALRLMLSSMLGSAAD